MSSKNTSPERFDVASFAAAHAEQSGEWSLTALDRLSPSVLGAEPAGTPVRWQAEGELRPVSGGPAEVWLHLSAQASVNMRCQRCLGAMTVPLDVDRWIRFVPDAAQAEALDAELEEDVLELQRYMDLREMVEDELLLALPLVPRHEGACPQPLTAPTSDEEDGAAAAEHPFAALAKLKTPPRGEGNG